MKQVKFDMSVMYEGVRYPAHTPFNAKEEDMDSLIQDGATILGEVFIPEVSEEQPEAEVVPVIIPVSDYEKMTVKQLKEYAAEKEIFIEGLEKKAEIIEAITEAEGSRE